jgi:hypothetical protein
MGFVRLAWLRLEACMAIEQGGKGRALLVCMLVCKGSIPTCTYCL